jgi:Family of unknown function (DUF6604)
MFPQLLLQFQSSIVLEVLEHSSSSLQLPNLLDNPLMMCRREGASDDSTQASNQKHQHFIGILRETLDTLNSSGKVQSKGKKETATADVATNPVNGLGNLFEHLEVDEPTEWTSSDLPKSTKILDTYELEPTDEDISFAIFCLFKDLTDIRHFVRETVSTDYT